MAVKYLFVLLAFALPFLLPAQDKVEKWDVFELTLEGSDEGNPFVGVELSAVFTHAKTGKTYEPEGFYDGNGIYKIRFMPSLEGAWTYTTSSNRERLDGKEGTFTCTAPSAGNHGPVRVVNQYHFAYEDGTRFIPVGTTIYQWAFHGREEETIKTLKNSPFNKARMLAVPPASEQYEKGGEFALEHFPYEGSPGTYWDFSRFNPAYFRHLEECVEMLRAINVEADLILFRPYDDGRWGFDMMDDASNQRFVRYIVARFAAYRNIWWSLANENSFIEKISEEDWDVLFKLIRDKDPYKHLRSIHNAGLIYDYGKPWVTHVSLQYYNAVRAFGASALVRDIYRKPVIHDEINYEGNISRRWGQLSGEEMTYRFWLAYISGTYATHGEAIEGGWLSQGGVLTGESPARIAFLKKIIKNGPEEGIEPIDHLYLRNAGGKYGEYYLYYFGKETPKKWDFVLPDEALEEGDRFRVEVIDTWNMTIIPVKQEYVVKPVDRYKYVDKKGRKVSLPGKPYMALRIQKIKP